MTLDRLLKVTASAPLMSISERARFTVSLAVSLSRKSATPGSSKRSEYRRYPAFTARRASASHVLPKDCWATSAASSAPLLIRSDTDRAIWMMALRSPPGMFPCDAEYSLSRRLRRSPRDRIGVAPPSSAGATNFFAMLTATPRGVGTPSVTRLSASFRAPPRAPTS